MIVSLHVYVEIRSTPTDFDRQFVTAFTAGARSSGAPIDLVVIHGPHTIQPLEIIAGTPVFWSLGNLASGMGVPGRGKYSDLRTLDGLAATARFTERADGTWAVEAAPVLLCEMTAARVVYPVPESVQSGRVPADELDDVAACIDRSAPVIG